MSHTFVLQQRKIKFQVRFQIISDSFYFFSAGTVAEVKGFKEEHLPRLITLMSSFAIIPTQINVILRNADSLANSQKRKEWKT